MGSLLGPFNDPNIGQSDKTAYESENSKNSVSEAIRWWYHLVIVCQAVVPLDWAVVPPSVKL